jgi:hypothetical protein
MLDASRPPALNAQRDVAHFVGSRTLSHSLDEIFRGVIVSSAGSAMAKAVNQQLGVGRSIRRQRSGTRREIPVSARGDEVLLDDARCYVERASRRASARQAGGADGNVGMASSPMSAESTRQRKRSGELSVLN